MVANIELEIKVTSLNCTVMMAHQAVVNARVLIAHTYDMMSPIKSKMQMSSDEPRPAKIYFIQLCAQQRHISKILVVRCSDNLFIGYCMPNSTLRRADETKQAVVVLPRHNNNTFIL